MTPLYRLTIAFSFSMACWAAEPVGLSVFFQNSQAAPIKLLGEHRRFLQEVDITVSSPPSGTDLGIQPVQQSGEFAGLNWNGVQMVEEDWRPDGAGKFTRQRFYRGARWMKNPSSFQLWPMNANGIRIGLPLFAFTGLDEFRTPADDGFVRRFVARQIALGCPAVNNCTGATFIAQALVQWRHNQRAEHRDVFIPSAAAKLCLIWTEQPGTCREVPVTHQAVPATPFGYGFVPALSVVNPPANGSHYQPGEAVTFRITLRDRAGNRLHPQGSLPTLADVVSGADPAGIRYFNPSIIPTLYYALKHREANTSVGLVGPVHKLKVSNRVLTIPEFFLPQAPTATTAADGFTGLAIAVPSPLIQFGLLPANTPVPDTVTFTIPSDAEAGTYVASFKGRREFAGEALNRGTSLEIKVGTNTPAPFVAKTGNCNTCHEDASAFSNVLHGISDRRVCFTCHSSLEFEPDNPLDTRVHTIHDRSRRFDANIRNCRQCHLTTPTGPARGILP